jgi:hypothetical protein
MTALASSSNLKIAVLCGLAGLAWYLYQIGSRKKERIRWKAKRTVVGLIGYVAATLLLASQGLAPLEAVVVGMLVGMGCAWLFVKPPKGGRRIPNSIRQQLSPATSQAKD